MEEAKEIWQKEAKQLDNNMCSFSASLRAFARLPAA